MENKKEQLKEYERKYKEMYKESMYNIGCTIGKILSLVDLTILAAVLCAVGTKICILLGIFQIGNLLYQFTKLQSWILEIRYEVSLAKLCKYVLKLIYKGYDLCDEEIEIIEKNMK